MCMVLCVHVFIIYVYVYIQVYVCYIWLFYIICIIIYICIYYFKSCLLCLDFLISEEEIDTTENKEDRFFLAPSLLMIKFRKEGGCQEFPLPSFASCSSLEINPDNTNMIFVIKLLYPKQMSSGTFSLSQHTPI